MKELALDSLRYASTLPLVAKNGLVVRQGDDGPRSLLAGLENLQNLKARQGADLTLT